MVRLQPLRERAVTRTELLDTRSVGDRSLHLEAVANDAGAREQTRSIFRPIRHKGINFEMVEGCAEVIALAQNRQPRQAGLIDLQSQPLEQSRLIGYGVAIFIVVIRLMKRMAG